MIDLVARSGYESHKDKKTGLNAVSDTFYTGGGGSIGPDSKAFLLKY